MSDQEMIYKSTLKNSRKWTDAMIRKYYPNPAKEVKNPYYKSKKSYLYYLNEVLSIENLPSFQEEFNNKIKTREKIKDATLARMAEKRECGIEEAKNIIIKIERIGFPEIYVRAINAYNIFHEEKIYRGKKEYIGDWKSLDKNFLDRITTNYIRHNLTYYDGYCYDLFGKIGRDEIYIVIKDRFMQKISEVYPELNMSASLGLD